jgi:uncharacterized membrane protein YjfL (UPF0719 family)
MQLSIVILNLLYAVVGIAMMYGAYRVFDHLMPAVDFPTELQKGNVAVAIFCGSLFIAIALTIAGTLG